MVLGTRRWGDVKPDCVVCVHGVAQHGGVFGDLAERLAEQGHSVVAVDLRGHGESGREPPWNTETHVRDLLETVDALGIERATWIGHSFGGRLVAEVGARFERRAERLILIEPALNVEPARALRNAEIERLDWSFATVDGAVNALLSSDLVVSAPREVVAAYAREDLRKGPDGRFRFSFCPSTVVVAWSEVTLAAPSIAMLPTLLLWADVSLVDREVQEQRYRETLGDLLTAVTVPNGHNVLWESPEQTHAALERFLAASVP
jgi:lipase